MIKHLQTKMLLLLGLLLAGVGTAWADTFTIGWGSASGDNSVNFTATSGTVQGIVSFTTAKNNSSSEPAYNSNNNELRLYYNAQGNGGSITLTPATGVTITGATITASTNPSVKYTVDDGTATNVAAKSGNIYTISDILATESLMIQNVNKANLQLRIKTIEITYTKDTSSPSIKFENTSKTIAVGSTYTQAAITENVENVTINYSSSNTDVATVSAVGEVTAKAAGTAIIGASMTVDNIEYTASYNLIVYKDGEFDFTTGYDYGSGQPKATVAVYEKTWTAGNVVMNVAGRNAWGATTSLDFRLYAASGENAAGSMTFSVPENNVITGIAIAGASLNNLSANSGTLSDGSWTGNAETVTLTASDRADITKILVTYGEETGNKVATLSIDKTVLLANETATITSDVDGLVVSYESSENSIATVSEEGIVTGIANGSATITATWEEQTVDGVTYDEGSKEFVITVKAIEDSVFDFACKLFDYGSGVEPTTDSSFYIEEETTWTAGNVTMVASGKYRWWNNDGTLRFYSADNCGMTFSVPDGYVITQIVITGSQSFETEEGTYASGKWTGSAQSVVLTQSGNSSANVKTVTVTYEEATAETVAVSIGSAGMATFCSEEALDFSGVDAIEVYFAEVNGSDITFTQVKKVPAQTGVLLRNALGEEAGDVEPINVPVLAQGENPDVVEGNALVGVLEEIASLSSTDPNNGANYILNNGQKWPRLLQG